MSKKKDCLILENGTNSLSRNFCNKVTSQNSKYLMVKRFLSFPQSPDTCHIPFALIICKFYNVDARQNEKYSLHLIF
jgi:hypothetical protein